MNRIKVKKVYMVVTDAGSGLNINDRYTFHRFDEEHEVIRFSGEINDGVIHKIFSIDVNGHVEHKTIKFNGRLRLVNTISEAFILESENKTETLSQEQIEELNNTLEEYETPESKSLEEQVVMSEGVQHDSIDISTVDGNVSGLPPFDPTRKGDDEGETTNPVFNNFLPDDL